MQNSTHARTYQAIRRIDVSCLTGVTLRRAPWCDTCAGSGLAVTEDRPSWTPVGDTGAGFYSTETREDYCACRAGQARQERDDHETIARAGGQVMALFIGDADDNFPF